MKLLVKKKNVYLISTLTVLVGLLLAGLWYQNLVSKAFLLKDHYPVFDLKTKSYKLVKNKPKNWVKIGDISKELKFAIVISEDWAFFDHEGVDYNQLEIVIEESIEEKKLVRGASTITQQVVKNALLSNERSLVRKFKEVLIAFKLEEILTKDEILEHYLNLIELGKGIYGVQKGSAFYFEKHPNKINAKEGAFLAMLLPSPRKNSQSFDKKELTKFAKEQVKNILKKMRQAKVITQKEYEEYLDHKLSFEKGMNEENILANDRDLGEELFQDLSDVKRILPADAGKLREFELDSDESLEIDSDEIIDDGGEY